MAFACKGKHEKQLLRLRASALKNRDVECALVVLLIRRGGRIAVRNLGVLSRPFSLYQPLLGLAFLALTLMLIARKKGAHDKSDQ